MQKEKKGVHSTSQSELCFICQSASVCALGTESHKDNDKGVANFLDFSVEKTFITGSLVTAMIFLSGSKGVSESCWKASQVLSLVEFFLARLMRDWSCCWRSRPLGRDRLAVEDYFSGVVMRKPRSPLNTLCSIS